MNTLTRPDRKRSILFCVAGLLAFLATIACASPATAGQFQSDTFHFSIELPDGWKVVKREETDTHFVLLLGSHDMLQSISLHSIKTDEKVDIDALAKADLKFFGNQGSLKSEETFFRPGIRTFYFLPTEIIEKVYESGTQRTKFVFRTNIHYAYVFIWKGSGSDTSALDGIAASFEGMRIPLKERLGNLRGGIGGWLLTALGLILLGGLLYFLGQIGLLIRRGTEMKTQLDQARAKAERGGMAVNSNWYRYRRKASRYIYVAAALAVAFYGILFALLSIGHFLGSLLGLAFIVAGYFGWTFGPSIGANAEDLIGRV